MSDSTPVLCRGCGVPRHPRRLDNGLCRKCFSPDNTSTVDRARLRERSVKVVACPNGEFSSGARFSAYEFRVGLDMGVWPQGMVIQDGSGHFQTVNGKKLSELFPKVRKPGSRAAPKRPKP